MSKRLVGVGVAFSVSLLAAVSCGGSDSGSTVDGTGGKGNGGTGGNGGSINLDGSAANGGSGGTIDPDAACAVEKDEATLTPVNMLVMFDRSGSMNQSGKWTAASGALVAFFKDPGTAGLRVALRFFPHDQPASGCTNQQCSVSACAQPLVPIGALTADPAPTDAQEQKLVSAVQNQSPGNGGGTPMYAALGGAESWATSYAQAHPAEKVETQLERFLSQGRDFGIAAVPLLLWHPIQLDRRPEGIAGDAQDDDEDEELPTIGSHGEILALLGSGFRARRGG